VKRLVKQSVLFSSLITSATCIHAATSTDAQDAELRAEVRQLMVKTEKLENQVNQLETALHNKQAGPHSAPRTVVITKKIIVHEAAPAPVAVVQEHHHGTTLYPEYDISPFRHPITVTTSPFMGLNSAYDASDLLQMEPVVNQDIVLLKQRKDLINTYSQEGVPFDRPVLEISGGLEGQIYDTSGFSVGEQDRGLSLSNANLDVNAVASEWASAYFSIAYDNSPASLGSRQPKNTLFLKRGFATIGDLNRTPLYMSFGQMYAPFGRYSSAILSTPLTMSLARIRTDVISLGFVKDNFYATIFGYGGFQTSLGTPYIKQWGGDVGFQHSFSPQISFDIRGGAVTNIADSEGMQNNGSGPPGLIPAFTGFGQPLVGGARVTADNLAHNVAGMDINAEVTIHRLVFLGEFAGATQRFSATDLTFNCNNTLLPSIVGCNGAQPQALHLEADYNFTVEDKPGVLGFAYGRTWQSFAINLPKSSYIGVLSFSFWKDTVESIEFRHDTNYPAGTTGSGALTPVNFPSGGTRNSVIGQLGVYF
jgi:hypothetical protein